MQEKLGLMGWIEIYAEHGETNALLRVWQSQMSKLEKEGFIVTTIARTSKEFKFYCKIDWSKPTVPKGEAARMLELSQSVA